MLRRRKKFFHKFFKSKTSVDFLSKKNLQIHSFSSFIKVPSDDQSDGLSSTNSAELTTNDFQAFTTNDFLELENKVYGDNWSIPYKRLSNDESLLLTMIGLVYLGDEPLGRCLLSATHLALAGTADQDKNCVRFMEELIPEAFRKVIERSIASCHRCRSF